MRGAVKLIGLDTAKHVFQVARCGCGQDGCFTEATTTGAHFGFLCELSAVPGCAGGASSTKGRWPIRPIIAS
jgi:hypothetical protein